MAPNCPTVTDSDSIWPPFCPSIDAAYLFTILFGLITIAHIAQGILHRKTYSWVVVFSALLQTTAYACRVLKHPKSFQ